jgi:hypothetical protein
MSLLPFFEWCEATLVGEAVRRSHWLFPVVESVHLLGLALLGGALLVVDLRLLGFGLTRHTASELARDAQPWLIGSILVMIGTGIPLFLSEAVKCYHNDAFWVKITTLPVAMAFTFTVRRRVALGDTGRRSRVWSAAVGVASLALWLTVGAAGRWIGFSG